MTCTDRAAQFERSLEALEGVSRVRLNYGAAKLEVWGSVSPAAIVQRAAESGFEAVPVGAAGHLVKAPLGRRRSGWTWLTLVSGCALAAAALAGGWWEPAADPRIERALLAVAIAAGGAYPFRSAYFAVRRGAVDMNVVMSVATGGAVVIGQWFEAAAVIFLFSLGELLEAHSLARARGSTAPLDALTRVEAAVERGGEVRVPVTEVKAGDVCIVRPGELIPADGWVIDGESVVDESPVTGAALPVDKEPGSFLYAGSVNGSGTLRFRAACPLHESTVARAFAFLEEAVGRKAGVERFADRLCRAWPPAAMILALAIAAVPPLFLGEPFPPWIYRGLALLLLSSPHALAMAAPVALSSALSHAARRGLLIKGGAELEALAAVDTVAFGKTGILTKGRFYVDEVIPLAGWDEERILEVCAALERDCRHPIAEAIVAAAAERGLEAQGGTVLVREGLGVVGRVGEATYRLGSLHFLEGEGVLRFNGIAAARAREREGKTVVGLAAESILVGLIVLVDPAKEEAARAVRRLRRLGGIEMIALLTGESRESARAFAAQVGIAQVRSELLPREKLAVIQAWQRQGRKVAVVAVGDGDRAVMAHADVAIALARGDLAAAAQDAHVVLMNDDLARLPYALALARRTVSAMRRSIRFAVAVKAAALALFLAGQLTLWMAVAAEVGATLLVTANGRRLARPVRVPTGKEQPA